MGCFSLNLGIPNAFSAELYSAMVTIEIAYKKGLLNMTLGL